MHRIDGAGHVDHLFVSEDPATNRPPTEVTPEILNALQEEVAGVVEYVGMSLNKADNTQLRQAIMAAIEARAGDYALDTGTANAKVVALNPAIVAYTGNFSGSFKNAATNTGATTINLGGGAVPLVSDTAAALVDNDLPAGTVVGYQYIHADGKAYITSMVASQGLTQAVADARYLPTGLRNKYINGACQVARRGNVNAVVGASTYGGCDRIIVNPAGTWSTPGVIAQSVSATAKSGFAQGLLNATSTGAGNAVNFGTKIIAENTTELNGKTITVNAALLHDAGVSLGTSISIYKANSKNNFSAITQIGATYVGANAASGVTTPISTQFTLGASDASNGIWVQVAFTGIGAVATKNFYVQDLAVIKGSAALPMEVNPIEVDVSLCLPYYRTTYAYGTAPGTATNVGAQVMCATGTGSAYAAGTYSFGVPMRAIPSVTFYSPSNGATGNWYRSAGATNVAVAVSGNGSASTESVSYTNNATVLTSEQICGHIVLNAEV